ncbi:unnamed protein product [Tilletia controversa]|nr:unnamed protein product [Tilletia controversa]
MNNDSSTTHVQRLQQRSHGGETGIDMWEPQVNTKHKTVDKKVRPVAVQVDGAHAQPLSRPPFEPPIEYTPLDWPIPIWSLPKVDSQRVTPERLSKMNFGPPNFLRPEELDAIQKVTMYYGNAFSFERSEKGLLKPSYAEAYRIRTVDHGAWKARNIPLPKARMEEIRSIYRQQMEEGDLELCDGPYTNPHFFVAKKNGQLRKVVDLSNLNAVTIRDSNVPPNLTEFCEDAAGRVCYGSGDGHSFFDQIPLHEDSRPLTGIQTYYGLLQSTRLPQGWINSPAVAQRISTHIFQSHIPERIQVFVDDVLFKGPRDTQDDRTLEGTNLRLWFLEYLRTYSQGLRMYEHAGLIFSGDKFIAITPRIAITGIVIDRNGKHSDPGKVAKLEEWPCPPPNIHSLRGFLGLANYLRPFIAHFATIDAPLRKLLTGRWRWNEEASNAMNALKAAAKKQPILVILDYQSGEVIILAVDSSNIAAGWALFQGEAMEGNLRKLVQYGSVGFSEVESRYSQPQLELCGVLKAVKNLRHRLYGVFFILEVDAASIRQMINAPDIPNAAMTRWVHYLKLFDMEVRHVPGRNHTLPDGLSRTDFGTVDAADEWPAEKIGLEFRTEGWRKEEGKTLAGGRQEDRERQPEEDEGGSGGNTSGTDTKQEEGEQSNNRVNNGRYDTTDPFYDNFTDFNLGTRQEDEETGEGDTGGDLAARRPKPARNDQRNSGEGRRGENDTGGDPRGGRPKPEEIARTEHKEAPIGEGDTGGDPGAGRLKPATIRRTTVEEDIGGGDTGGDLEVRRPTPATADHKKGDNEDGIGHDRREQDSFKRVRFDVHVNTVDDSEMSWEDSSDITENGSVSDTGTEDSEDTEPLNQALYSGKWRELGLYLESGCSHPIIRSLDPKRRKWIKQQVGKYFVRGGRMYRRQEEGAPLLVVDDDGTRMKLLTEAHDGHGHRGRDATYGILAQRFWWETLRLDCAEHVTSCHVCQKRQHGLQREPMRHAQVPDLFERFNLDIVDLGPGVGPRRYMVVARDAFTGWPEARLLPDKTAASVRSFVEEELIARYGAVIRTILTDNGTENASETTWLIKHLGFQHAHSTPYNPEGNTEIERGHATLVEGLLKVSYDDRLRLATYLPTDPPHDLEFRTYLLFDWTTINSSVDLLAARTRQLKRRVDDLELAKLRMERAREQQRAYADDRNAHRLRDPLVAGQLVIVSNPTHSARGQDRWLGPYRVSRQLPGGSYQLVELNGVQLKRVVAAKHLRRYFPRSEAKYMVRAAHQPEQEGNERLPGVPTEATLAPELSQFPTRSTRDGLRPTTDPQPLGSQPLPLPRARMSRPAVPARDIPPTGRIGLPIPDHMAENGLQLPQSVPVHTAPSAPEVSRPTLPSIRAMFPTLAMPRFAESDSASMPPQTETLPAGWVLDPSFGWGFHSQ